MVSFILGHEIVIVKEEELISWLLLCRTISEKGLSDQFMVYIFCESLTSLNLDGMKVVNLRGNKS